MQNKWMEWEELLDVRAGGARLGLLRCLGIPTAATVLRRFRMFFGGFWARLRPCVLRMRRLVAHLKGLPGE
jgi:hypothetical protein